MFHLSIAGTRNGTNIVSVSRSLSLCDIRDKAKRFKKISHLRKGKSRIRLYMIHTLFQFCNDNLSGYDVKQAKISRLRN